MRIEGDEKTFILKGAISSVGDGRCRPGDTELDSIIGFRIVSQ
jgi:hypothetical protein